MLIAQTLRTEGFWLAFFLDVVEATEQAPIAAQSRFMMLTKSRINTIYKLAYPIAIGLSSQVVMAVIDLAMVGNLGEGSIAAVGLASFCNFFVLAFVMGGTPAVQGLVARRRGEKSKDPESLPLIGGITISLLIGLPLSLLCYFLCPSIFSLISSDAHVMAIGIPFLKILSISLIASGINASFEGYWNGIERPKVYMSVVLFMNCLNIFLNYLFIFGKWGAPALGAHGAALGTATSLYVGVVINLVLVTRRLRGKGRLFSMPTAGLLVKVFQLGAPVIVQQFFYALGFIVFLWMVGKVSTSDLAGASVLIRIADILGILATAVGTTAATLVSRTIGEGDVSKAAAWAWDCAKIGVGFITFIGLPLLIFPHYFLSIFLSNPDTIAIAVIPLQIVAATSGIASLIFIFSYTLLSLGDGNRVILVSFSTQWLLFLPGVWIVGPYLKHGLLSMYIVQTIYGAVATLLIIAVWMDGRWKTVKL